MNNLLKILILLIPYALNCQPSATVDTYIKSFALEYYIKYDIIDAVNNWHFHNYSGRIMKNEKNDILSSVKKIINSEYKVSTEECSLFRHSNTKDTFFLYKINLNEVINKNDHMVSLGMNQRYILVNNTLNTKEVLSDATFNKVIYSIGTPVSFDVAEYLAKLYFAFIKPGVGYCTKLERLFDTASVDNQFSITKSESGFICKYQTNICLYELPYNPENVIHYLRILENGDYEYKTEAR